ncbi:uncharacterized protein METZ01_LOCUS422156, partial [marine metagenome]
VYQFFCTSDEATRIMLNYRDHRKPPRLYGIYSSLKWAKKVYRIPVPRLAILLDYW